MRWFGFAHTDSARGAPALNPASHLHLLVHWHDAEDRARGYRLCSPLLAWQALLEEGFLISGRMLKDHLVTAVQEGLEGALDMAEGGAASEQGSEHSHDSDSEGEPRGLVRLCLSCHPRRAARRAAQVRKKREEHVKDGPHASKTGQVAHLSSAVDH